MILRLSARIQGSLTWLAVDDPEVSDKMSSSATADALSSILIGEDVCIARLKPARQKKVGQVSSDVTDSVAVFSNAVVMPCAIHLLSRLAGIQFSVAVFCFALFRDLTHYLHMHLALGDVLTLP